MSRIQQVLHKAEREGTARHTRGLDDTSPSGGARPSILVGRPDASTVPVDVIDRAPVLREPVERLIDNARPVLDARPHPLLVAGTAPHSPAAERYRSLRTRIAQAENGTARRLLMLTSPGHDEGKSMTTLNLGITMAQEFHRRILVIDADLRRPSIHVLLGLPEGPGLSDVLLGGASLEDVVVTLPDYRLAVVPAGLPADQPTELLGSAAMRRLLDQARSQFDRILIDTPPVGAVADASVLARLVDGMLLVVRAGKTSKPAIERALFELQTDNVLGLVLNDAGGPDGGLYPFDADTYHYRATADRSRARDERTTSQRNG